jgi:hypothetical protein
MIWQKLNNSFARLHHSRKATIRPRLLIACISEKLFKNIIPDFDGVTGRAAQASVRMAMALFLPGVGSVTSRQAGCAGE